MKEMKKIEEKRNERKMMKKKNGQTLNYSKKSYTRISSLK
jgi:DNA-binding XRE family transcriptional regulator